MIDCLLQPPLIGHELWQIVTQFDVQCDFGGLRRGIGQARAMPHQTRHINAISGKVEPTRLDACNVKNTIDQPEQLLARLVDLGGEFRHPGSNSGWSPPAVARRKTR